MDTSETYIKMRLAAILDLGRGTHYLNTFCAMPDLRSFVDKKGDWYVWTGEDPNWCQLERQDQLQEMVIFFGDVISEPRLRGALKFIERNYVLGSPFTSMEQLWFAFVMSELCNKAWNGEEWLVN